MVSPNELHLHLFLRYFVLHLSTAVTFAIGAQMHFRCGHRARKAMSAHDNARGVLDAQSMSWN